MIAVDMAMAKLSSDALEVFTVDNSQNLLSCSKLSGDPNVAWGPWRSFPGTGQLLRISTGLLFDRRALLCATDTGHQLWSCSKSTTDPKSAWTVWSKVPGAPPSHNLTVAQLPNGAPQVLVLDGNQQLQTCSMLSGDANTTWGAWERFPGLGQLGQVTAASLPDRRTVLLAIDVDRQLWSCWRTTADQNSAWTTWTKVSGAPTAISVTIGTLPDGVLELFVVDPNHTPWHCWQISNEPNATGWTPWRAFPNEGQCLCIAARTLPDGRNALWAIDTGHKLFRCIRTAANPAAGWTKWAPFDGGQTDPLESPAYCQQALAPAVVQKWAALAHVQAPNSSMSVREYLGSAISSDGPIQYFQRGMIAANPTPSGAPAPALPASTSPATIAVYGPIYLHYRELNGASGRLGLVLADAAYDGQGGMWQGFANGEMHWHPGAGAFALDKGPLLDRWKQVGGPGGLAGYPIVDEAAVVVGKAVIARLARFQNASFLLNGAGHVHVVAGDIRIAYENRFGGPTGPLGLPVSDEKPTPSSGGRYQDFEHGCIVWHPPGSPYAGAFQFRTMQVTVQRFRGFEGDEIGSGGLSLYIWHQVASSYTGALSQGRFPGDGSHDGDTWDLGPLVVPITDRVHGDLSVTVFFEGWDEDSIVNPDDKLGTINFGNADPQYVSSLRPAYTVDNLWGRLEQQSPEHRDGDFAADYILSEKPQSLDTSQPIRSQVFWPFKNFRTDTLSHDQYAETFANVDRGMFIDFNPAYYINKGWQAFLYGAFYRSCASGGNCFGMCLEALYSRFGRSLYAEPIFQWGNSQDRLDQGRFAGITNEINVKHGYQLGAANFGFLLASFLAGMTHDPIAVFKAAKQAFDRGDYPIIELCDYFGQRAHAVLPIGFDDTSFPWKIIIADPNHPFEVKDFDSHHQIQVYSDNSFKYVSTERDGSIQSEPKYSGNELLGSRMFYVPYSILSYKPHTPETQFVTAFFDGVLLMVGNAAQTEQITDLQGRSFYKSGAAGLPTRWQDIMPPGPGRIPGLARIPLSQGDAGSGVEVYFGQTDAGRLVHAVCAPSSTNGSGGIRSDYMWGMHTPAMSVLALVSASSNRADTFSMELAGSADPTLTITAAEGKTMDLHVTNGRGETSIKAGVALKAQQAFTLKLSELGLHCK